MLTYSYKPNLFARDVVIELAADRLLVKDQRGTVRRELRWSDMKAIQQIVRGPAVDPDSGKFTMVDVWLKPWSGRALRICSGSFIGTGRPIQARNQQGTFSRLVNTILRNVASTSPEVPVTTGSIGVSLGFATVAVLALGLLALGVAIPLASRQPFTQSLLMGLLIGGLGLITSAKMAGMARAYWPETVPLSQHLDQLS